MVKMVVIEPVDRKPEKVLVQDWNEITNRQPAPGLAKGQVEVAYATAIEAIRNSGGCYRIKPQERPVEVTVGEVSLEKMGTDQLKLMAASIGVTIRKQMKVSELRALVKKKISEVPVVEDDGDAEMPDDD